MACNCIREGGCFQCYMDRIKADSERLNWILEHCRIGYDPWQSYLADRAQIDEARKA